MPNIATRIWVPCCTLPIDNCYRPFGKIRPWTSLQMSLSLMKLYLLWPINDQLSLEILQSWGRFHNRHCMACCNSATFAGKSAPLNFVALLQKKSQYQTKWGIKASSPILSCCSHHWTCIMLPLNVTQNCYCENSAGLMLKVWLIGDCGLDFIECKQEYKAAFRLHLWGCQVWEPHQAIGAWDGWQSDSSIPWDQERLWCYHQKTQTRWVACIVNSWR